MFLTLKEGASFSAFYSGSINTVKLKLSRLLLRLGYPPLKMKIVFLTSRPMGIGIKNIFQVS